jgi:phospholipase C
MKEENSRRAFFKKAAAAVGVVVAAGYTKSEISSAVESNADTCAKYAADVASQEKAVKANQLVVMTDEEKQQRLEDLLNFHRQETA